MGILDTAILFGYLAVLIGLGFYANYKQRSVDYYVVRGRRMGPGTGIDADRTTAHHTAGGRACGSANGRCQAGASITAHFRFGSFVCSRNGSNSGLVTGGKQTFRPERRLGSDTPRYQPQRHTAAPGSPGQTASSGNG